MKLLFIACIFLAFTVTHLNAYSYSERKALKDATANGIFLSYLKRQNKDLRQTIDTLEEMQQEQQQMLTSAKEEFWLNELSVINRRCCFCKFSKKCKCCHVGKFDFCCDLKDNNIVVSDVSFEA